MPPFPAMVVRRSGNGAWAETRSIPLNGKLIRRSGKGHGLIPLHPVNGERSLKDPRRGPKVGAPKPDCAAHTLEASPLNKAHMAQ